ncbi:MAG: CRISPR-associated helicase Cas3' [Firmicutes bacterium]|nr:CRISPR-associated helicase Cas3' [Bacillota bacterium]
MAPSYAEYFETSTGFPPFPYQQRLAACDSWPNVLRVPTGLGKTAAVVLAWLWRRRIAEARPCPQVPRRLVYCLPMRTLVEQTVSNVEEWLSRLGMLADHPGDSRPLSGWCADQGIQGLRVAVEVLMGGNVSQDWDNWPERDMILVGTQDQLLSRALNRGYGMSRYRWPIQFALLNSDVFWVFDEVQLMAAGLPTSTQLQAFREAMGTPSPTFSLWMSATLDTGWLETFDFAPNVRMLTVMELTAEDRVIPEVEKRLTARKPFARAQSVLTSNEKVYAQAIAAEVRTRHISGTTTLIVVNRVSRAQAIYVALKKLLETQDVDLMLLHARFRRSERLALEARLREPAPKSGRIIVATQTVEAGIDLSARTLFTELAPWTSLVQRFGRCNRYGEVGLEDEIPAHVYYIDIEGLGAPDRKPPTELASPYTVESLVTTRLRLADLADAGISSLPPVAEPAPLYHVVRRRDLLDLFDTTADLAGADLDVSRFVRDVEDTDVEVFWREWPKDSRPAESWPAADELVTVSLGQFRRYMEYKGCEEPRRAYVWNALTAQWDEMAVDRARPGQVILLDGRLGGYSVDLGFREDLVEPVPMRQTSGLAPESYDGDELSEHQTFVPLAQHLEDVAVEAKQLAACLPGEWPRDMVIRAARLHDIGKAHPVFQDTMVACLDGDDGHRRELWAKSPCRGRHSRPRFRHELVSALWCLQLGESDLVCYLVAAHHGKVRMSIRSLPDETEPPNRARFARGVWEGDQLPEVRVGDLKIPEIAIDLSPIELGSQGNALSWTDRMTRLLEQYGPFRLAWMEAVLRIADWRASQAAFRGGPL